MAGHVGKYNGLFARLCLLFHCIDHVGGELPEFIETETAARVRTFLHGFLLPHALNFYAGVLGLSSDQDKLTAIAGYILSHKPPLRRITNRDIQRAGRSLRRLARRDVEALFEQLDALGWVTRTPAPRPSDPPHWVVNPEVYRKFASRALIESERKQRERTVIASILGRS